MAPRTTPHGTQITQTNANDGNNNSTNASHPADIERQAQEDKKDAISLPYSRLLSILGAFLTLKALHAISALTNGKRPSQDTQIDVEARIVVHFLSIVPESLYRPQPSTSIPCDGSGDSPAAPAPAAPEAGNTRGQVPVIDMANASTEEASLTYFNTPLMRTSSSLLPAMHMSPYVSQAGYSNGNGNGSGNGNGNPNPASNDSPALSFSAFALPSNTNRDDNSFIQSLAGCAPYRRAARESAVSRDARRHDEINKSRQCYIERQEVSAERSTSPEAPPPGDEQRADELHIANACPAQHHSGPEGNASDQERTRSSFPGENPVSCGRGGERMAKTVTSVRPFTDLD